MLSEKVHATVPKGIVGGFDFTVLKVARPSLFVGRPSTFKSL